MEKHEPNSDNNSNNTWRICAHFQFVRHSYLIKPFKQFTRCFCDDLYFTDGYIDVKRIRDHLRINNQEVSVSEHKAKIFQKNSGWLGQWANIWDNGVQSGFYVRITKTRTTTNKPSNLPFTIILSGVVERTFTWSWGIWVIDQNVRVTGSHLVSFPRHEDLHKVTSRTASSFKHLYLEGNCDITGLEELLVSIF